MRVKERKDEIMDSKNSCTERIKEAKESKIKSAKKVRISKIMNFFKGRE